MNYLSVLYGKFLAGCKDEKGQTMVEYALLLVLIAIVVIAMVMGVGKSSCNSYSAVCSALQPS